MLTGRRHLVHAAVLAGLVLLLAACGGGPASRSSASTLPGQGKPTIVLGDKGSDEQHLLGELYAQAFRALGYVVVLEPNIGDTHQIQAAFQSGQINAYPEYLGELAAVDAGHAAPLTSESEAEQIAQQYEQGHGATVMTPVTPFSNTGELITLESFAKERNLTTIEQIKDLPFRLKFGDHAGEETQYAGYMGLQQAYGLTNLQFVAIVSGTSIYDALAAHLVQVGDAFATDPQLTNGTYAILTDPKNVFGFQHVGLVINTSLLSRLGPQFEEVYATVTNLLTLSAIQALNTAVAIDNRIPSSVAHSFLLANHLVSS